jgi:hypothetical protein
METEMTTKVNAKNVKGHLYSGNEFVGSIVKVGEGYQVWEIRCGYGKSIDGRVFKSNDFKAAGQSILSASRTFPKYELVAG